MHRIPATSAATKTFFSAGGTIEFYDQIHNGNAFRLQLSNTGGSTSLPTKYSSIASYLSFTAATTGYYGTVGYGMTRLSGNVLCLFNDLDLVRPDPTTGQKTATVTEWTFRFLQPTTDDPYTGITRTHLTLWEFDGGVKTATDSGFYVRTGLTFSEWALGSHADTFDPATPDIRGHLPVAADVSYATCATMKPYDTNNDFATNHCDPSRLPHVDTDVQGISSTGMPIDSCVADAAWAWAPSAHGILGWDTQTETVATSATLEFDRMDRFSVLSGMKPTSTNLNWRKTNNGMCFTLTNPLEC